MRAHFTKEQIEELRALLAGNAVKDTELPEANSITDSDSVAIIQDGKNKKINVKELIDEVSPGVTIKIGNGLQKAEDSTVSVRADSSTTDAVKIIVSENGVGAEARLASKNQTGVVKIGEGLSIDNGVLSTTGQSTTVEPDNETIEYNKNNKLSVKAISIDKVTDLTEKLKLKADANDLNSLKETVESKVSNTDYASNFQAGVIKIGERLSINNGVLSADNQITDEIKKHFITDDEREKLSAVRAIVADGTTITEKELEDGSIQFSAVGGGGGGGDDVNLKINDIEVVKENDVIHFELDSSLAFENNKINSIWTNF